MTTQLYKFVAWSFRAKNISRWPLQKKLIQANVAEHTYEVTTVASLIAHIDKEIFKNENIDILQVVMIANMHESSEFSGVGDVNTKCKNYDTETKKAFKRLEHLFELKLIKTLPDELQSVYKRIIQPDKNSYEAKIVKAADLICALEEAHTELRLNNNEFRTASQDVKNHLTLFENELPAVKYFMNHFFPCFNDDFDQLNEKD